MRAKNWKTKKVHLLARLVARGTTGKDAYDKAKVTKSTYFRLVKDPLFLALVEGVKRHGNLKRDKTLAAPQRRKTEIILKAAEGRKEVRVEPIAALPCEFCDLPLEHPLDTKQAMGHGKEHSDCYDARRRGLPVPAYRRKSE